MADLDPLRWLNPSLSVPLWPVILSGRKSYMGLFSLVKTSVRQIWRAIVLAWYSGEDKKKESRQQCFWQGFVVQRAEAAQFWPLTRGKKSCCKLWLYKWGSDEWKQPCIFTADTLVLGPVPASTFLKAIQNRTGEIKCLAVKVFRSINLWYYCKEDRELAYLLAINTLLWKW